MTFEKLNKENIDIAIKIQRDIFPLENGSEDLRESLDGITPPHQFLQKYWLVKVDNKYIGICGLYAYDNFPKDAWLGWFGVVESERRKGYGRSILVEVMNIAKDMGFENLRLYTDEEDNHTATILYEKVGMVSEIYNNPEDKCESVGDILIYSKSLKSDNVSLWDNKNLYLHAHEIKNKE